MKFERKDIAKTFHRGPHHSELGASEKDGGLRVAGGGPVEQVMKNLLPTAVEPVDGGRSLIVSDFASNEALISHVAPKTGLVGPQPKL